MHELKAAALKYCEVLYYYVCFSHLLLKIQIKSFYTWASSGTVANILLLMAKSVVLGQLCMPQTPSCRNGYLAHTGNGKESATMHDANHHVLTGKGIMDITSYPYISL